MSRNREPRWLMWLLLLSALFLTILPWPDVLNGFLPYWVALVLLYWSLEGPQAITLGLAFLLGIILDVVTASLLGQHALSLVVMMYLVGRFRYRIRFFPPWQQALAVLALLVNDRVILLWIMLLVGEREFGWQFWMPAAVGSILWPWLFLLFDRMRGAVRRRSAQQ